MTKRSLAIAGLLVLAVAAAGCGKEKDKPADQQVQATPRVTPQVTEAADLVDMEVSAEKNDFVCSKWNYLLQHKAAEADYHIGLSDVFGECGGFHLGICGENCRPF